jgi:signal transduction histidine kinase
MAAVAAASGVIGWAAWRGLTRPAEVDVRSIASSLAVNGVALICVLSLFKMATTTVRALGGSDRLTPTIAIVAAVCSIALEPIRRHLRLAVEAILFGRRPDPVVAAGRVARGIGDDPRSALGAVVGALSLPFAELRVDDLPTVSAGESTSSVQSVPVVLGGQNVGELVVGLRAGDRRLTAADTTVLALAAPLLAQTMRSRALADSLQEARERAADAREEERRRLRRDLHDGLGPRLSGIAFTADAVLLARTEPAATTDQLTRLRTEAVTAIREIRELVYGLRPPALDEFGLVRALELQTAALATADGRALRVQIHATDLPELPASVEVAAYRIAVESLTNAARHSGSDCARVDLACDGPQLVITVTDGGRADGPWTPGVGLVSMRERAQELGGTLTAGHGTVRAVLPIRVPDQA